MSIPALLPALPLLAAFVIPILHRISPLAARALGPGVLAVDAVLALSLWDAVRKAPLVVEMGGFAAPAGIVFYLDPIAVIFLVATLLGGLMLWPRGLYDRMREGQLTLLLTAAGCGLAMSGDLFNIFVFYEIAAVASYGLTATWGSKPGYAAALRYLLLSALGSAFALLGITVIYAQAGTLNLAHLGQLAPAMLSGPAGLAGFALVLFGFGVKAELFPVNTWVPEVYANAPSRISALLAGVVSKLALLAILRLMLLAYADTPAPGLLLAVGIASLVTGELAAFRALGLRRVLGYSSIGQLGLVAIAFSIPGAGGVLAGLALALHHMIVKPALFLFTHAWGGPLARLEGGAKASPWGAALFALLALSLVGVPPLPGFWAKLLLLKAAFGQTAGIYYLAIALVLITTVVEAAYLLRILRQLYRDRAPQIEAPGPRELLPALTLGALLVLATIQTAPLADGLAAAAARAVDRPAYIHAVLKEREL